MSKHREDSYIFCASLMKAGERNFISKENLLEIAQSKDFKSAITLLHSFGYGDGKELENPRDFNFMLEEEEEKVSEFVFSALPERSQLELLKFPKDYHNVKAVLKAEALGISPESYMVSGGTLERESLAEMIKERNFIFLSVNMKEAIDQALEVFAKGKDPQEIDIILDKACYKDMLQEAENLGNSFVTGYVKLLIDILNVNIFVRLRQIKKPVEFFSKVFLDGGDIQEKFFRASYEEGYKPLAEKFQPFGFGEAFGKGATAVEETGKYYLLEKLCDDARIEYIKGAKFVSFGIEPAAAYLIAKESEVKNLRMILTGKIAGTANETIVERLRETYV